MSVFCVRGLKKSFHQGRILLCYLVHLRDRLVHLPDPRALIIAGRADLRDDIGHAANAYYHFVHGLAGLNCERSAAVHFRHRVAGHVLDFPCGGGQALREAASRCCDNEEASLLAGARRFNGCVHREVTGLEDDAVDHGDNVDVFLGEESMEPMMAAACASTCTMEANPKRSSSAHCNKCPPVSKRIARNAFNP